MLRVVFFDAAGTLIVPREPVGESYARMARQYGVHTSGAAVNAAFRRVFHETPALAFGPGLPAEELRRRERQWWRKLVVATFAGLGTFTDFDAYFAALFDFFADPGNWTACSEAAPTLELLRRDGVALGVISNFDHRLYRILDGLGLRRHFESITLSSETGWAKPHPQLFEAALHTHGVTAAEALHVGDSDHHDIGGAQSLGIATVHVDRAAAQPITIMGRSARVVSLAYVPEAAQKLPFP
jgi:putative hydrolase of the HAD superfamily